MAEKNIETHETCTSTRLDKTRGSKPEHINQNILNALYQKLFGSPVSDDPVTARLQREQAIVRHKRQEKGR